MCFFSLVDDEKPPGKPKRTPMVEMVTLSFNRKLAEVFPNLLASMIGRNGWAPSLQSEGNRGRLPGRWVSSSWYLASVASVAWEGALFSTYVARGLPKGQQSQTALFSFHDLERWSHARTTKLTTCPIGLVGPL